MALYELKTGLREYKDLEQAIDSFNATSDDYSTQKLYWLQRVNYLIERAPPSPELHEWLNHAGAQGFEEQLQKFGVHRDASPFLKTIEFARALHRISPDVDVQPNPNKSLYELIAERDALLNQLPQPEAFEAVSQQLFALSQTNEMIQEKALRHQHFLALSYAKAEAIKNLVEQNFQEYSTRELSSVNNVNFFLDIAGEPQPLVIRVEDRTSLDDEPDLQAHAVSEYFAEDYITMMIPIKNESGEVNYQPVAISQFASGGSLNDFSKSIAQKSSEEKGKAAQNCFSQLSGFLIELENSGHYHPDIKLTNFLYDNGRVLCADRKTLVSDKNAMIGTIATTPNYMPPEFLSNVYLKEDMIVPKRRSLRIGMPSFMSYQTGLAISDYLQNAHALDDTPLANEVQNLVVLQNALLHDAPNDRLSLADFHQLVQHIEKEPALFLSDLEQVHPTERLSSMQSLREEPLVKTSSPTEAQTPDTTAEQTTMNTELSEEEEEIFSTFKRVPITNPVDEPAEEEEFSTFKRVPISEPPTIEEEEFSTFKRVPISEPPTIEEEEFSTFKRVPIPNETDSNASDEETEVAQYSPAASTAETTRANTPVSPKATEALFEKQRALADQIRKMWEDVDTKDAEDAQSVIRRGDAKRDEDEPENPSPKAP